MRTTLSNLRGKLDRLKVADRGLRVFGAGGVDGHGYRELPCLDEASIGHLESSLQVRLPDELRAFLETVHGGGPGPGYGLFVDAPAAPTARAARPFPYGDDDAASLITRQGVERLAGLPLAEGDHDDDWPPGPGFVALAHHGCGCFDVLVVTGEQRGLVWFCDMQWFPRFAEHGQLGFLDWYESWLDHALTAKT